MVAVPVQTGRTTTHSRLQKGEKGGLGQRQLLSYLPPSAFAAPHVSTVLCRGVQYMCSCRTSNDSLTRGYTSTPLAPVCVGGVVVVTQLPTSSPVQRHASPRVHYSRWTLAQLAQV